MRPNVRFWIVALAAGVGVAATASLGRWQLARAAQKEALQTAIDQRAQLPPLGAAALDGVDGGAALARVLHRRVALQGCWLSRYTLYLDNRQMHGRPGFFVVTPLQLAHSPTVVLVQRGWVPRNFQDRTALPAVDSPQEEVLVEGRIAPPPSRLYEFSGDPEAQGSSRIRQNLDLAAFRAETGLPLADVSVLQTGASGDGLQRDWPAVNSGVEKHYGYAFQWFGLSGLIAILYVWFQLVRRFRRSRPAA
ncbi:transmembrane cytochrome oxidase [Acidovorax sp. SRB_24]|nr:SURF1 family protein [Acidovorax sp. SRB_24]NMM76602.1 transmembrane cytochrome oxidase [Acidovorax sp. SRB_24]